MRVVTLPPSVKVSLAEIAGFCDGEDSVSNLVGDPPIYARRQRIRKAIKLIREMAQSEDTVVVLCQIQT